MADEKLSVSLHFTVDQHMLSIFLKSVVDAAMSHDCVPNWVSVNDSEDAANETTKDTPEENTLYSIHNCNGYSTSDVAETNPEQFTYNLNSIHKLLMHKPNNSNTQQPVSSTPEEETTVSTYGLYRMYKDLQLPDEKLSRTLEEFKHNLQSGNEGKELYPAIEEFLLWVLNDATETEAPRLSVRNGIFQPNSFIFDYYMALATRPNRIVPNYFTPHLLLHAFIDKSVHKEHTKYDYPSLPDLISVIGQFFITGLIKKDTEQGLFYFDMSLK